MRKLSVINDVHIGALRSGGTTPASAYKLRQYLLAGYEALLGLCADSDVLINGDLFDNTVVASTDLWQTVQITNAHLQNNLHSTVWCAGGNHDYPKTMTQMSSFQLFCKVMTALHPARFVAVHAPLLVAAHDLYVIPHVTNQDLMDLALAEVPAVKYLAVHCNYANKFAEQQDHSLNMSSGQAGKLPVETIIFGHEHQRRSELQGKVVVVGNQIPSSVADCLGNDAKYMLCIQPTKLEHMPVWEAKGSFARVDWREIADTPPDAQFVRVQGDVTPAEAPAAVNAISKLRSTHNAFVITNAVQIEERDSKGEKITLEQIQGYDILKALLKRLSPEQGEVVKELLKEEDNV